MAITKVPNGPLIKPKGPFKGSTLKAGGKIIKKAQNGKTWQSMSQPEKASKIAELKQKGGFENVKRYKDSISTDAENRRNAAFQKNADVRGLTVEQLRQANKKDERKPDLTPKGDYKMRETKSANTDGPSLLSRLNPLGDKARCIYTNNRGKAETKANGGKVKKAKAGAMIKRADGSFSKPGLWDNIRKNKGSGKKPTKQMLVQEKKIKAKSKK